MMIFDDATVLYRSVMRHLLSHGEEASPRGMRTIEVRDMQFRLTDVTRNVVLHPVRRLNYAFMAAEFVWILTGQNRVDLLTPYNGNMIKFSDDRHHLQGAYGPMWVEQFPRLVQTLMKDTFSRQAVVQIWRPNPAPSKDIPCTLAYQFLLREGRLHMTSTMRSNDAWHGLPYDLFTFTMLQRYVASAIGVKPGSWTHQVGSFHLYEDHFELAEQLAGQSTEPRPVVCRSVKHPWKPSLLKAFLTPEKNFHGAIDGDHGDVLGMMRNDITLVNYGLWRSMEECGTKPKIWSDK